MDSDLDIAEISSPPSPSIKGKKRKIAEMDHGVGKLANSIRKRCETLPPLSSNCCIYKIPPNLKVHNKPSFKPLLISIGPFHYGKKKLQSMQDQKLRYLKNFLRRNKEKSLEDYLRAVRELENEIRECYVETIELNSEEFVEMVLMDAIFVIEFLLLWHFDSADESDQIFSKPSVEYVVKRDLLLLENQLPFFVLEGLYNIVVSDDGRLRLPCFVDLVCEVLVGRSDEEVVERFDGREVLHLVDFLRTYYLPSTLRGSVDNGGGADGDDDGVWEFPPGVGDLYDAGVKFKAAKNGHLLDIKFENGVLIIPTLDIEDHTEALLLNLSAFEQCHYHFDSYIVDYVVFMDVLISTLKDVEILMTNGIVANYLGSSEDVADLFNTICGGTTYQAKGFYYSSVFRQLNSYAKTPWNRWRATLNHDYFGDPWTIISVIVAIFLLIITVIQTYCSVVSL